ncbi:MAG TPA: nitronate monooxygenase [Ktedonobacterales bacterium]
MLHTFLTTSWGLRYPIIGAPMAGAAGGRLARAVSQAGGLGMIGIGSQTPVEYITREAALARGDDEGRFGIGLMAWALEARPELLEAAIQARPFLISISFGSPAPYVEQVHRQGIHLATQVHSRAEAIEAAQAGIDLIVAQGTEAGGHTGQVSTLPLLQIVLEAVQTPVLAAGGIASPRGVAAALAAGAEGVWVGTRLLATVESATSEPARARLLRAQETETIHTRVFDLAQGLAWPAHFPGRALRNRFTDQWDAQAEALREDAPARQQLAEAIKQKDYDLAVIYAGEAVALVTRQESAGDVIRQLGDGAEQLLHARYRALIEEG